MKKRILAISPALCMTVLWRLVDKPDAKEPAAFTDVPVAEFRKNSKVDCFYGIPRRSQGR